MDIDKALEGIRVVISTTSVTVAVDIHKWHCGDLYIYSFGGCDCGTKRELFQCSGRAGRNGIGDGDGPGQISNPEI